MTYLTSKDKLAVKYFTICHSTVTLGLTLKYVILSIVVTTCRLLHSRKMNRFETVFLSFKMVSKMSSLGPESLLLPHRIWKVKFVGESVDDCGGGYSESIAEICDELQVCCIAYLIGEHILDNYAGEQLC